MNFAELGFNDATLERLQDLNYHTPTEVQRQAIGAIFAGKDVIVQASTGTGKTAAFSLPIVQHLVTSSNDPAPRVLILAPTRELVAQLADKLAVYSAGTGLRIVALYGGANIQVQRKQLIAGTDIVIATPGRLFDLLGQGAISLDSVRYWVIDEADRMLDMGFVPDVEKLSRLLPGKRQTLLFSATFDDSVQALAAKLTHNAEQIALTSQRVPSLLSQQVLLLAASRKAEWLAEYVGKQNLQQVLVFVSTKQAADELAKELTLDGIRTQAFHGDKTQGARMRALEAFKTFNCRVLVATDLAARGLDIAALPLVVNFSLPDSPEDFIHRIGRSARAGHSGMAITLISPAERLAWQGIAALLDEAPEISTPEGYEFNKASVHIQHIPAPKAAKKPFKSHKKRVSNKPQANAVAKFSRKKKPSAQ
ncbi:DEAD/DEAH box helicase [Shewanella sp. NIFS-20-20]|uniref:DEAD/DEAH box helicase n=1 Tax=Shewanella sp. NIFS-20-20 TaxID=2853806 RepID=UPI001C440B45|nr:DEAD/DEAH box helicase [Shewanella sp. NIFS-20-20]MBV7315334.1 DEAD/DEAH box helicase [Shewanella sp. NIFS-20-20]